MNDGAPAVWLADRIRLIVFPVFFPCLYCSPLEITFDSTIFFRLALRSGLTSLWGGPLRASPIEKIGRYQTDFLIMIGIGNRSRGTQIGTCSWG